MRLVTFRHADRERIGAQLESQILDLSRVSAGIPTDMKTFLSLGDSALAQTHEALASVQESWLLAESDVTLLAPIPRPDKILCIGHNYHGHIGIGKTELPEAAEQKRFLQAGDVVEITIEKLGTLRNTVQ